MRILMLRLGPAQLAKDMSRLWPHTLNELDNLFDSNYLVKSKEMKDSLQDRLKLVKEGLSLVQLMSRLNIEDFYMN